VEGEGGRARTSSDAEVVQVLADVTGEAAEQAGEFAAFLGGRVGEQHGEPLVAGEEEPLDRLLALRAEPEPAGPGVVGVTGPADQADTLESLGLAGDGRCVDAQAFGQVGDAQAGLFRVQRVADGQAGLVDTPGPARRCGCSWPPIRS
jgi:hypothetical protein